MKKHNGMRPQDIAVLLKIVSIKNDGWRNIDIANDIHISPSEVSEALNRCKIARLIDSKKRSVHINSLKEFLLYGLKYVFPVEPGSIVKEFLLHIQHILSTNTLYQVEMFMYGNIPKVTYGDKLLNHSIKPYQQQFRTPPYSMNS